DGVRAVRPGDCPLCGMPLVSAAANADRATLHDGPYDMTLSAEPIGDAEKPSSRQLRFTLFREGRLFRGLIVTHEHLLHLIVVSADLSFFDHVHPVLQPDGSFVLDYEFPGPGRYLLFADVTPRGDRNQVFRFPVTVGVEEPAAEVGAALTVSPVFGVQLKHD